MIFIGPLTRGETWCALRECDLLSRRRLASEDIRIEKRSRKIDYYLMVTK